ncbi:MAG: glycosyltransferase family 2 protein [Actinomycetota bacterium]|nr:glycosyltransferase family 2 protein [Actinomycetota bacterium]
MTPAEPSVAVVVPAYQAADSIVAVLENIPDQVQHVIVVDDASPDALQEALSHVTDPRLIVCRHPINRGVGGAMKTGFEAALDLGADVVVKIDADGQMDPGIIDEFIEPILRGEADMTKGNRFAFLGFIRRMPFVRRIGNIGLSFLAKAASGYWHAFDPTNGYIALRASVLKEMDRQRLAEGYFFEISLLCEVYFTRAILQDVPMHPSYGDETSSLRPMMMVGHFTPRLIGRFFYRIFMNYYIRDFNSVSLFLTVGVPTLLFGIAWSLFHWVQSARLRVETGTGTIFIGALAILIGFQLILQANVLDVENEPGRGGREPHRPKPASSPTRRGDPN